MGEQSFLLILLFRYNNLRGRFLPKTKFQQKKNWGDTESKINNKRARKLKQHLHTKCAKCSKNCKI